MEDPDRAAYVLRLCLNYKTRSTCSFIPSQLILCTSLQALTYHIPSYFLDFGEGYRTDLIRSLQPPTIDNLCFSGQFANLSLWQTNKQFFLSLCSSFQSTRNSEVGGHHSANFVTKSYLIQSVIL